MVTSLCVYHCRFGLAVLYITTDMHALSVVTRGQPHAERLNLCMFMHGGELVETAEPGPFLGRPEHPKAQYVTISCNRCLGFSPHVDAATTALF
eukprot:SAG31_NODE_7300_length_1727_cov_1.025184_2_plen_94_part_00